MSKWLVDNYIRIMDRTMFVSYIVIGVSLAYAPEADSLAFIERAFRGIDRGLLAWLFFILPSPIFLLREAWLWKFAGVAPLAYVLGALGWFLLITPNRSWFLVPVFVLTIVRMCLHYARLMIEEKWTLNQR